MSLSEAEIRKLFPEVKSTLAANKTSPRPVSAPRRSKLWDNLPKFNPDDRSMCSNHDCSTMRIVLQGIVKGGKNNYIVTRQGKHIPKAGWAKWRDEKLSEVRAQLPANWVPIAVPVNMELNYVAGDKRRRDFPAICDAIYHVLERAGVVADDALLWPVRSSRAYDKASPGVEIILTWTPA